MTRFVSDNVTSACQEVMDAVVAANNGVAASYGDDTWSSRLQERLSEIFEKSVVVFPTVSGTAANSLALSALTPSFGKIFCHEMSHMNTDECGGPEFFTGGAKLIPLRGKDGKIEAEDLKSTIHGTGNVHHAQPSVVSVTQACETGTVYQLDEISAISETGHAHGLRVHMDGARFANALVTLGVSPAEITWKSGIDVLSFGGTKNGCLAAEAVIFFDPEAVKAFPFMHKRSGHLLSKMRFVSAQLLAYLSDDVWLRNARNANAMAGRLSNGLANIPGVELAFPTQSNEVFAHLPESVVKRLNDRGYEVNDEELDGTAPPRFVAAWNTTESEVDDFLKAAAQQ